MMTVTAQLADGTALEFPEGTPDSVVQSTVKRIVSQNSAKSATKTGESAAKEMSFGEKVAAGAGSGVENILHSIGLEKAATAVRGGGTRDNLEEINKGLGGAGTLGRIGAEVAITALPGAKAAGYAAKVLPWLAKGTTAANAARAAIEGAVAGGMTSEDNLRGAAGGAVGGAVASPILTKALSVFGKPVAQTAAADAARKGKDGVELTAGQGADIHTMGGRVWKGLEEGLSRVPFLGRSLAKARERGETTWRDRVVNSILPGEIKATGQGGLLESENARKVFTELYQTALKGKKISIDEPFESFVIKAVNDPTKFMSGAQRAYVEANVGKHIFDHARNPLRGMVDETLDIPGQALPQITGRAGTEVATMPGTGVARPGANVGPALPPKGPTLKDIVDPPTPTGPSGQMYHDANTLFKGQSELRHLGRKMARGGNPSNEATGKTMNEIADEVYKMIGRQDDAAGTVIERLRLPYTKLLAVEKAAKKAGGEGNFTPSQLRKASEGLNDEMVALARQGETFMPKIDKTLPATLQRTLLPYALSVGGLGAAIHTPATMALGATIPLLGTKLGQKALRGDTAAQKLVIEMLRKNPTLGSNIGGLGGAKLAEEKR